MTLRFCHGQGGSRFDELFKRKPKLSVSPHVHLSIFQLFRGWGFRAGTSTEGRGRNSTCLADKIAVAEAHPKTQGDRKQTPSHCIALLPHLWRRLPARRGLQEGRGVTSMAALGRGRGSRSFASQLRRKQASE